MLASASASSLYAKLAVVFNRQTLNVSNLTMHQEVNKPVFPKLSNCSFKGWMCLGQLQVY